MYTVIYLYRIKQEKLQNFIDINEKASEIYLASGALEDMTYLADDLNGNHGCKGLLEFIDVAEDEAVVFGQSVFRNKSHYNEVLDQVNEDPEINELFDEMKHTVDFSKVITSTFSTDL
ncbi:DUF1428 family protein [Virgibacillus siamensis]|uniref:DUF1428 family protein n=1 Tax=Virgibacillus siamensis TaxID=480071 RepID=UPI000986043F|nr:DUF1428 family protein [Virgibacillus siamensis]